MYFYQKYEHVKYEKVEKKKSALLTDSNVGTSCGSLCIIGCIKEDEKKKFDKTVNEYKDDKKLKFVYSLVSSVTCQELKKESGSKSDSFMAVYRMKKLKYGVHDSLDDYETFFERILYGGMRYKKLSKELKISSGSVKNEL